MSSFLYNPLQGFYQPAKNVDQNTELYQHVPSYAPQQAQPSSYRYTVSHPRYQEEISVAQFKVFAFDNKLTNRQDWSNASSVYRFELLQNRSSFGAFLNVLKNHGICLQSHKFYYVDDEQDLVVLSSENDFKYMLQIMKGKTIKVSCEKISQVNFERFSHPRASTFRNLPFFVQPKCEKKQEERREENLIEKALESVFAGIFEEKKQETPQRIHCMFPRPRQEEQTNPRVRTIRLSDLLKNVEEPKKEEKTEKRSFEDYLVELFGKKLAERNSQDSKKQEEQVNNEPILEKQPQEETLTEPTVEQDKVESTAVEEKKEESIEEKPVLSTSQIISNYLINEDEDVITSDEEDEESDDQSSETSEQVNQSDTVQYPSIENTPSEEPSSIPISSNEEQLQQYEKELKLLSDMGFTNTNENLKLLNKYNGDIQRSVSELIYYY